MKDVGRQEAGMSRPAIIGVSITLVVLVVVMLNSVNNQSSASMHAHNANANANANADSNDLSARSSSALSSDGHSSGGHAHRVVCDNNVGGEVCHWQFTRYIPSKAEFEWRASINDNKERICDALKSDFKKMYDAWVGASDKLTPTNPAELTDEQIEERCGSLDHHSEPLEFDESVFSHMLYQRVCKSGAGDVRVDEAAGEKRVYLEPLGGTLRHPKLCDNYNTYLLDKNYMVTDGWLLKNSRTPGAQAFLFDAGASSWLEGSGGPSQPWLYHVYRDQCMELNQFHAWELVVRDPKTVIGSLPGHLRPRYHWFNVGISAKPESWDNPLNHIRQLCKPEDYVVFKLDIDNTPLEELIVKQMMESPDLHKLIDEFYWENHVDLQPLRGPWAYPPKEYTVAGSMDKFARLREKGIRSHSWT